VLRRFLRAGSPPARPDPTDSPGLPFTPSRAPSSDAAESAARAPFPLDLAALASPAVGAACGTGGESTISGVAKDDERSNLFHGPSLGWRISAAQRGSAG